MMDWTWYKALTLAERTRLRRNAPGLNPATERSRKRLAKWKSQPAFASDTLFQQRLKQAGLTESQLLELLSEAPGAAPEVLAEPPAWAIEFAEALADSASVDLRFSGSQRRDPSQIRFLELVRPLIARAVRRLREGITSLIASAPAIPLEAAKIEAILVNLLPNRLLPFLLRTLVLELNVVRVQGLLAGESSEERFESFIADRKSVV